MLRSWRTQCCKANEVHRLLTYYSTSCYQTRRWWHVRVSAGQCTSASAGKAIELLECETSDFISLDLWSPTALTSIRSITSSGGHATAGLSDDVQECGWTQEATCWNLEWSGIEHYWHCYQRMEKTSTCFCVRAKGRHFEHLLYRQEWRFDRSRSSKVIDFGTNWKYVCNFLLVLFGCSRGTRSPILGSIWAGTLSYSTINVFSKYSNLCGHRDRRTDTDGRTIDLLWHHRAYMRSIVRKNDRFFLVDVYILLKM